MIGPRSGFAATSAPRPEPVTAGNAPRPAETPAAPPADASSPRETVRGARSARPIHPPAEPAPERPPEDFAALLLGEGQAAAVAAAAPAAAPTSAPASAGAEATANPDQLLAMLAGAFAMPVAVAAPDPGVNPPATPAAGIPTTANPIALALTPAGAAPAPLSPPAGQGALPALSGLDVALDAVNPTDAAAPADGGRAFDSVLNGLATPSPTASASVRETTPPPPPLQMPADPANGFDDGVGTHIAWMAGQRLGEARITVSPEHLGPIEVTLKVDDARVDAQFHSTHVEVRAALEASVPRLREMLAQHGLQLGQADVGQRHGADQPHAQRQPGRSAAGDGEAAGTPVQAAPVTHRRGLLDEYA